jgi:uncharacterized protein
MTSERIEALKKRREKERNQMTNRNQNLYAWLLLAAVILLSTALLVNQSPYMWVFPIGIMLGFTLERSRFCFAAAVRNPLIVGTTKLLQAVILALMVSTLGFFILQIVTVDINNFQISEIPGSLRPVGWNTVIGGILFGTGMVIAGGCASGTLMRIGEGFTLQIVVLGAFVGGSVLSGVFHYPFWHDLLIEGRTVIYLPQLIGFFPALILQLSVLGILFAAARKLGKMR